MKKSILFLYPTLRVGGAERMLQRLVNGLSETWDCSVAYLDQGDFQNTIEFAPTVKLIRLPVKRARYAHLTVLLLLWKMPTDIVFSSWSRTNLLLLSIKWLLPKSINIVIREPNLPSFTLSGLQWRSIYEFLYKLLYRKAKVIICQSQLMQDELQSFFSVPGNRLKVLHNMLPVEDIITKANVPITELNLQPFDILTCGRLLPQKGFDLLIESFFDVKRRHPSARLIILGEGLGIQNQRNFLEAKVAALGLEKAVLMPGHNANPYKFMSRCAVFVSSSRWEGLPNAVLEAMACGATVVATDCPGATGEIIEHGKNGWLVPPEDVLAIADAIDKVLSGNWKLNAYTVREQARQFDVSNILPKFDLLLSEQLTDQ